jgi:hypothetical protein
MHANTSLTPTGAMQWPPVTRNAPCAARASILALARAPLSFRGTHRNFEDVLLAGSGLLLLCRRRLHLCAPVIKRPGSGVSPHELTLFRFFFSQIMVNFVC